MERISLRVLHESSGSLSLGVTFIITFLMIHKKGKLIKKRTLMKLFLSGSEVVIFFLNLKIPFCPVYFWDF